MAEAEPAEPRPPSPWSAAALLPLAEPRGSSERLPHRRLLPRYVSRCQGAALAGRRDRYSASPAMVRVAAAALSFRATARRRRCRSACCLEPTKRPRPGAVPRRAPARLAGSAARCSIIAVAALPAPPPAGSPASAMLCFEKC